MGSEKWEVRNERWEVRNGKWEVRSERWEMRSKFEKAGGDCPSGQSFLTWGTVPMDFPLD